MSVIKIRISPVPQRPVGSVPDLTGRVFQPQCNADGTVTVRPMTWRPTWWRSVRSPENTDSPTRLGQIRRFINEAVPDACLNRHGHRPGTDLTWEEDRGQALDDLAEVAQGRWYVLGDARSWCATRTPHTPVAVITDGPGGLGETADRTLTGTASSTRDRGRRAMTAPTDPSVRNNDTTSATMFGDRYGRVSKIIKIQTPLTSAAAQQLAVQQLATSTALAEQWSVRMVPDSTLEPGDTVTLSYRGQSATQVIDSITYPLTASGLMSLETRSSVPEPVTATEG
jgi:hypothetical protein